MAVDRQKLDALLQQNDSLDWWQPARFRERIKPYLPEELEIIADPPMESENYNCFLYALGLADNHTIREETHGFLYDTFVQTLLEHDELIKTDLPNADDLILYKDLEQYPDRITHIGILEEAGRVRSKWAWGPVVRHAPLDVPQEFGNHIFYAKHITPARALELYEHYQFANIHPSHHRHT